MSNTHNGPAAVLHNVFTGVQVLAAELYWLAIPDLSHRHKQRSMTKRLERLRLKLLAAPGDTMLTSELAALEAAMATEASQFSAMRAQHLERLRQRIGLASHETTGS